MTIMDVLKMDAANARLSLGGAWLVWDEAKELWIVYWQVYRKGVQQYGVTIDEAVACRMLLEASGVDVDAGDGAEQLT